MKVIRRYAFLSAFVLSHFLSPISYAATSLEKCVASRVIGSLFDVDFSQHKICLTNPKPRTNGNERNVV